MSNFYALRAQLLLLIVFTTVIFGWGQDPKRYSKAIDHGDLYFKTYNYSKAIGEYKTASKIHPELSLPLLKIGECYEKSHDLKKAENWYAKGIELDSVPPEYYYKYAVVLTKNNKHAEAKPWFEKYGGFVNEDSRYENFLHSIDNLAEFYTDSTLIVVRNLAAANSIHPDFSPHAIGNELIIISTRSRYEDYKGDVYFDLFHASINDTTIGELIHFEAPLNSEFHEGPLTYDPLSQTMYLTRNIEILDDLGEFQERKLGIFEYHYDGRKENMSKYVTKVKFLNFDHNAGHPALSRDGRTMYFISNTHFGKGGTDIYKSRKKQGVWQEPALLEKGINTSGNEMFPFIYQDSLLYFASDGHGGIGGLDIFKINLQQNNPKIVNLGAPFNSHMDDFGIFFKEDLQGYFTSNRAGGKGLDDIYHFELYKIPLKINIIDELNQLHNLSSIVKIKDKDGKTHILDPDKKAHFEIDISPGTDYKVLVESDGKTLEFDIKLDKNTRKDEHVLNVLLEGQDNNIDSATVRLDGNDTLNMAMNQEYKFTLIPLPNAKQKDSSYFHTSLKDYSFHPSDTIVFSINNEVNEDYIEKDTLSEPANYKTGFPDEFKIGVAENDEIENEYIRVFDSTGNILYDSEKDHAYEFIPSPQKKYKIEVGGDNIDTKEFDLALTENRIKENPELLIDLNVKQNTSEITKNERILLDDNDDSFALPVLLKKEQAKRDQQSKSIPISLLKDSSITSEPTLAIYDKAGNIVYPSKENNSEFVPTPDEKYTFSLTSNDRISSEFEASFSEERINSGAPLNLQLEGTTTIAVNEQRTLKDPTNHSIVLSSNAIEQSTASPDANDSAGPLQIVIDHDSDDTPQTIIYNENGELVYDSNSDDNFVPIPNREYRFNIKNEDQSLQHEFTSTFSEDYLKETDQLQINLTGESSEEANTNLKDPEKITSPYVSSSSKELAAEATASARDFEFEEDSGTEEADLGSGGNEVDETSKDNGSTETELATASEGARRDFELQDDSENNGPTSETALATEGKGKARDYDFSFDIDNDQAKEVDITVTDSKGNIVPSDSNSKNSFPLLPDEEYLVQITEGLEGSDTAEFVSSFTKEKLENNPNLIVNLNSDTTLNESKKVVKDPEEVSFNFNHLNAADLESTLKNTQETNLNISIYPDTAQASLKIYDDKGQKVYEKASPEFEYHFEPDTEYRFELSNNEDSTAGTFSASFSEEKLAKNKALTIDISNTNPDTVSSGSKVDKDPNKVPLSFNHLNWGFGNIPDNHINPDSTDNDSTGFDYHHLDLDSADTQHNEFSDPDQSHLAINIHPDSLSNGVKLVVYDSTGQKVTSSTEENFTFEPEPDHEYRFELSNQDGSGLTEFTSSFSKEKIDKGDGLNIDLSNTNSDSLSSGTSLKDPKDIAFNFHHLDLDEEDTQHNEFSDPDQSHLAINIHPDSLSNGVKLVVYDSTGQKVTSSTEENFTFEPEPDHEYRFELSNQDGSSLTEFTSSFSQEKIDKGDGLNIDLSNTSSDSLASGASVKDPDNIAFNFHHLDLDSADTQHNEFSDPDQSHLAINIHPDSLSKGIKLVVYDSTGQKLTSSTEENFTFEPEPDHEYRFELSNQDGSGLTEFTSSFSKEKIDKGDGLNIDLSNTNSDSLSSGTSLKDPKDIAFNFHHLDLDEEDTQHNEFSDPDQSHLAINIHPDSLSKGIKLVVYDSTGQKLTSSTEENFTFEPEPDHEYRFELSNQDGSGLTEFTSSFSQEKIDKGDGLNIDLSNTNSDSLASGASVKDPDNVAFNFHHLDLDSADTQHDEFSDPDQSNINNLSNGTPVSVLTRSTESDELIIEILDEENNTIFNSSKGSEHFSAKPNEKYTFKVSTEEGDKTSEFVSSFSQEKLSNDPTIEIQTGTSNSENELLDPSTVEINLKDDNTIPSLADFTEGEITFVVQIAAAREPIPESYLKKIYAGDRAIFTYEEEGWYKYGIAKTESYFEAKQILEESDVDGFIPAYNHSKKISVMQAMNDLYVRDIKPSTDFINPEKTVTLNFDYDKFEVSTENLNRVKNEVLPLIEAETQIVISGHTDRQGSEAYNYSLSLYRANHVKNSVKKLLENVDIKVEFYGETQLLESCEQYVPCSDEIHQKNRRVEIYIYNSKKQ